MARGSLGARLRRLIAILHRDLGYLAAGTTLLYAVSGLAVNHVRDWNPSYRIERFEERFAPIPWTGRDKVVAALVRSLRLPGPPRETFRPAPERIRLFYDGFSIDADLARGIARGERPVRRPLLHFANRLHLNQAGPGWTLFADLYAVCLAFLAASGLFILKGRAGFAGRGKWLALAGLALPLGFWVFAG